jgi:hypothetical protein
MKNGSALMRYKIGIMSKNFWSSTYILAIDEAAAHRLAAMAEAWGAEPNIYSQEDTERALGTSCANERLVQMWWD